MQNRLKEEWKKIWTFLNEDSWSSLAVFTILMFAFLYFVFMPLLSFLTGTQLSLVIVESCSMHHSEPLDKVISNRFYAENNVTLADVKDWNFKNGFNKGDIIFSLGPKNLKVGDVIIFDSGRSDVRYPIIHRIIRLRERITTKGDNNPGLLEYEKEISYDRVLAKSLFRIPYIGWIKLIFFDWKKDPQQRGFC